uniref:Uncharacterized protein n=1 Tax=Arundo donax TaxID=35708 RepID=A0A0A9DT56_ARUDO
MLQSSQPSFVYSIILPFIAGCSNKLGISSCPASPVIKVSISRPIFIKLSGFHEVLSSDFCCTSLGLDSASDPAFSLSIHFEPSLLSCSIEKSVSSFLPERRRINVETVAPFSLTKFLIATARSLSTDP